MIPFMPHHATCKPFSPFGISAFWRKAGLLLLACCLISVTTGCSIFVARPRVAHVQVKNLNDKVEEYTIVLDDQPESDFGIKLTDRHTIKFDFQWLWDIQDKPRDADLYQLYNDPTAHSTPWFRCVYWF